MLKVAVCDDEKVVVSQLEAIIIAICEEKGIAVDIDAFYCGETLEKEILKGTKYDLLYLDIQMKNENGIAAAKCIRKTDENAVIIYVSGYDEYWMDLFEIDVFGFIKKPVETESFTKKFLKAYEKICSKKIYFFYHYKGEEYKVLCDKIMYFESVGRKIRIFLREGAVEEYNGKLSEAENYLQNGKIPFLRIHQSYLVNFHQIKSRSPSAVTLVNDKKLPVSMERQKSISRRYGKLLRGEVDE